MDARSFHHALHARSTRTVRSRWASRGVAASLFLVAAALTVVPGQITSAAPGDGTGCGYGSDGPYADTLCWIDMAGYDDAAARSGSGQPMSATLPGGYTVEFTVRTSGTRGIVPSIFPTWDYGAAAGKYIYLDTPGQPALYQQVGGGAAFTTISLTDISVTDSGDNPVHGWRFVGIDAESTADTESITFSSDVNVSTLATFTPPDGENGCQVSITQDNPKQITCTGSAIGDKYGTVLVGATEPGTFTQTMTVGNGVSREGVAFAFQSSTISLDAVVAERAAPGDTFEVSVVSPEDQVVGSDDTGDTERAATGDLIVLPRVDGSAYTLRETGGTGTDLGAYEISWACTRNGVADDSLSATGVESIEVSPDAGDAIACTVSNALAGETTPTVPQLVDPTVPGTTPGTPATPATPATPVSGTATLTG